jgi:uncharacterized C2H2 Zn-finger protein
VSTRETRAHKNVFHYNKKPKTMTEISVVKSVPQMNRFPRSRAKKQSNNKSKVVKNNETDIDLTPIEIPAIELMPIIDLSPINPFKSQNGQQNQSRSHPNPNNKTEKSLFKCDYFGCDKAFRNAIELIKHNNRQHSQIDPILTLYDDLSSTSNSIPNNLNPNSGLDSHFNAVFNPSSNDGFSSRESSSSHSNSSSVKSNRGLTPKDTFVCTQCNKIYENKSQFLIHCRKSCH